MSFSTRLQSVLIGSGPVFTDTPTLVDELPELTEEGWDTLRLTYAMRRAALTAEQCAALFPCGAQIGSRKWWIVSARPQRVAAGFWLAQITCKGWAAEKPAKIRVGTAAGLATAQNAWAPIDLSIPSYGQFDNVEGTTNTPSVSVSYLAEGLNSASNTGAVGTEFPLPAGLTVHVPANVWSFLSAYNWTYHWPHGWVLMGSEQDRIAGTDVGLVTDNYQFIRQITPGNPGTA